MEEFFPGLLKMIEERLGRFGRPITTVVVICLALGVIAWGLNQFIGSAITPMARFIQTLFSEEDVLTVAKLRGPVTAIIGYLIFLLLVWAIFVWLTRRLSRRHIRRIQEAITKSEKVAADAAEVVAEAQRLNDSTKEMQRSIEATITAASPDVPTTPSKPDMGGS